jgi:hypothetical protein
LGVEGYVLDFVGPSQHSEKGPVGVASELWSFDVLERTRI